MVRSLFQRNGGSFLVDALEPRRLLAAALDHATGTLNVTGTYRNDVIYVWRA